MVLLLLEESPFAIGLRWCIGADIQCILPALFPLLVLYFFSSLVLPSQYHVCSETVVVICAVGRCVSGNKRETTSLFVALWSSKKFRVAYYIGRNRTTLVGSDSLTVS
jgi:hypothetical protein